MITTLHNQSFRPGQQHPLAGRLHRILLVLGFLREVPANPLVFTRESQKVLSQFQKKHRQQPTGLLNEKTSLLLEQEYVNSGYGQPYQIQGAVTEEASGEGIAGLLVEAMVVLSNRVRQVAEAATSEKGAYQLAFDEMSYAELGNSERQQAAFFLQVEQDGEILQKTAQQSTKPGTYTINMSVGKDRPEPVEPEPDEPDNPGRKDPDGPGNDDGNRGEEKGWGVIRGKVLKSDRQAAPGLIVKAFDKNIGKDVPLGKETSTGRAGDYEIEYALNELPRGKEQPDIFVKVLDDSGKTIGQSTVKYNAPAEVKVNVLLAPESLPEEDEYTQVKKELQGYLNGASLADLEEDEEHQDITYLANKSGLDARIVAMASLSEKYAREHNLPSDFYYALFRAGYPTDPQSLSQMGTAGITRIWEEAGKQNIIRQELQTQIKKGENAFANAATSQLLSQPSLNGVSSLKDMLQLAELNEEEQRTFTRIYLEAQGDTAKLWEQVGEKLGSEKAIQLQTDGKLGYLTMNNAPLIKQLRSQKLIQDDPVQLIENGLYKAEAWQELIKGDDIEVPEQLAGDSEKEKKAAYASQMANRLKVSYPTAVLSHQIRQNEMPVINKDTIDGVTSFLQQNQLDYQIGETPLLTYLKQNDLQLDASLEQELKSLERVYKITPSDEAMKVMLQSGIDSAMAVTTFSQDAYVEKFSPVMGTEVALRSYQLAQQVHATTLNTAVAYLAYRRNPVIRTIASEPAPPSDILAYPTLEGLFGEMDYCECSHCRSVLSPAAYMVDLLNFIDKTGELGDKNPLDVLLERRPDIEHLQLTCENTNTVLPYIDLVNEILEFFTVHANQDGMDITDPLFKPLEGFSGYNMDENSDTAELVASPQYVQRKAYDILKEEVHPAPFNQPLAALRLLFEELEVPLGHAIETLREDNTPAAWLPVHLERTGLSPEEYRILTDNEKTVSEYYGKKASLNLNDVFSSDDKYAKHFTASLGISYKELTEIVKTRFINPAAHLLPGLERLYVSMSQVIGLIDGDISEADFTSSLPADLDLDLYGGDVAGWIQERGDAIKKLILLTDTEEEDESCNFEKLQLLFADGQKISQLEYLKFLRFVRLWKKLGWTIDQMDRMLAALWPDAKNVSTIDALNDGFKMLLNKLAHLMHVMDLLRLKPKRELQQALALFADIDTHGHAALYRQLFLNSALSEQSDVFEYNPNGEVLTDSSIMLVDHEEAVLGALNITSEKLHLLLERLVDEFEDLDEVEEVPLTLTVLSSIYRYNLLARELKMSLEEILILQDLSQIDPFAELTPVQPPLIRFIETARRFKDQKVKLTSLTYYLRHEDLSGEASPTEADILAFAQQLTAELQRIEAENSTGEEATADLAREKMSLLYDADTVNLFFSIIDQEILFDTAYDHHQESLESEIAEANERLSYNNFQKKLSFAGLMTTDERDALKTAGDIIADSAARSAFHDAVDALYDEGQATADAFFTDNPNLQNPYDNFVDDADYSKLIEEILVTFKEGLKRQQAVQLIADSHKTEPEIVSALLEEDILASETDSDEPAIADFLALAESGINVRIGLDDSSTLFAFWATPEAGAAGQELPDNAASLSLSFYVLPAESDFYSLRLETGAGANVDLLVNDELIDGTLSGTNWENDDAAFLEGNQYHRVEITIENFSTTATLKWAAENGAGSYQLIPVSVIFPAESLENFADAYLRFLKALAITDMLELNATEISYFGDKLSIGGEGFLKSIPLSLDHDLSDIHRQLFEQIDTILYYNLLKEAFEAEPEDMITILLDPEEKLTTAEGDEIYLLMQVTDWDEGEVDILLDRFGLTWPDLSLPQNLYRVYQAYQLIHQTGLSASLLIKLATHAPDMAAVNSMENAIRLKYDNAGWLKIIQPINDKLRNMQRDALVAYVLRLLAENPKTQTVDTADKLFEYFLIDVQMDACMKTSRIKQALSSIQLFINRCLLNLEANVSPDSINKKQWVWMKRYRVWEANRKVFLYPENWLEPELRDNKSSFFKDLESELLQSEINEDTAHVALLHYLEKLDTVAKLEICAYYLDEKEGGTAADDILHVFGRTSGAKRIYYYRRLEYGYWTPWEKVDVEIEDNPILPVVWDGRLFLFWLMVITQGDENDKAPLSSDQLDEATVQAKEIKYNLEVTLCWSEYYNQKWQPKNTSDVQDPMIFSSVSRDFKRSDFFEMRTSPGSDGELEVYVNYQHWKLYNKHSHPEKHSISKFILPSKTRTIDTLDHQVHLKYNTKAYLSGFYIPSYVAEDSAALEEIQKELNGLQHTLYLNFTNPKVVQHTQPIGELFEAPFFIQNYRHVFYVVPEKYYVPVRIIPDYGWDPPILINPVPLDPVPLPEPIPIFPPIWVDKPVLDDIPLDRDPVFDIDTNPLTQPEILPSGFSYQEGFHTIKKGLLSRNVVTFGSTLILPSGNANRILGSEETIRNL